MDLGIDNVEEDDSGTHQDRALVETFLLTFIDENGRLGLEYMTTDTIYEAIRDSIEENKI